MRAVKLFIATSLDAYIAREDGGVDWLFQEGDYGWTTFIASVDTALIGRRTFDFMVGAGAPTFEGLDHYVFSRTLSPDTEGVTVVSWDPADLVTELRRRPGKDIWLVGGGELNTALARAGMIDEMIVSVHPVVLGSGIPLFAPGCTQTDLEFVGSETWGTGLVQLSYRRKG